MQLCLEKYLPRDLAKLVCSTLCDSFVFECILLKLRVNQDRLWVAEWKGKGARATVHLPGLHTLTVNDESSKHVSIDILNGIVYFNFFPFVMSSYEQSRFFAFCKRQFPEYFIYTR